MSDFNTKHNRVVWMDIPVANLDRSIAFYTGVLAIELYCQTYEDMKFAILEHEQGNGGCLVVDPDAISAVHGPLLYMNVDGRIREAVARVTQLGGAVTQDVHAIGPYGFRALVTDSEGNRLALHSNSDA